MKKGVIITIAVIVLLLILSIAGYSIARYYLIEKPIKENTPDVAGWKNYTDDALGISFKYPAEWGDVSAKNSFGVSNILRELSFTNQPGVEMVADSGYLLPAEKDYYFIAYTVSHIEDIKTFCSKHTGNFEDRGNIVGLNGVYIFGECDKNQAYIARKESNGGRGWIPVSQIAEPIESKINISERVFVPLDNKLYESVTIKVNVADIMSEGFCEHDGWKEMGGCINKTDKKSVDDAVDNFKKGDIYKSVNYLVGSIKNILGDKYLEVYKKYFDKKRTYRNEDWGIEFKYPAVFGEPKNDKLGSVVFENEDGRQLRYDFRLVEVNTLIQAEKKANEACEGAEGLCYVPVSVTNERLNYINDVLDGKEGNMSCLEGEKCQSCEVASFGGQKMLFINQCWSPGGDIDYKYFNLNGKVFEIDIPVKSQVDSSDVYHNLRSDIYKNILESIKSI